MQNNRLFIQMFVQIYKTSISFQIVNHFKRLRRITSFFLFAFKHTINHLKQLFTKEFKAYYIVYS